MKIKYKLHYNVIRYLNFCVIWILVTLIYFLPLFFIYNTVNNTNYSLCIWLSITILIAFSLGILDGIFNFVFIQRFFQKINFILLFILKTFFYILSYFLTAIILIIFSGLLSFLIGINSYNIIIGNELKTFFQSELLYQFGAFIIILSFTVNFLIQINSKLGPNILINVFLEKYRTPKLEKKILLFLDIAKSTTIAEKIGAFQFSALLQDFFRDIDIAITNNWGQIYKFVGDEVIITWNVEDGINNKKCIQFFFDAKKNIYKNKDKYMSKYGVFPEFKAGLHIGNVIITEIGVSKQEITYYGDTVNTTARIRSMCNEKGKEFLISAQLLSYLPDLDEKYNVEAIGVLRLKGKANVIGLFSIEDRFDITNMELNDLNNY